MPRQLAETNLPSLPSAAEDPVERRRLLNILAQRRYRNRKRARLASLESQLQEKPGSLPDAESWQETGFQSQPLHGSLGSAGIGSTDFQTPVPIATGQSGIVSSRSMVYNPFYVDACSSFPDANISTDLEPTSSTSLTLTLSPREARDESFQGDVPNDDAGNGDAMLVSQTGSSEYMSSSDFSSGDNNMSNLLENHAWDDLPPDDTITDPLSFNDEIFVTTPGLSLVRAHVTILQRLHRNGGQIDVWDLFSVSPFYQPDAPSASAPPLVASLPDNYHPTALQKAVQHHPVLDLLPWPSARTKILYMLTLPMEARPQRIKGDLPSVTMQLMFDMKDAGGGIRVWGSNPFDENNWEVGPVFFQQWWWALNSEIVKRSNQIRTERGEDILRLKSVS